MVYEIPQIYKEIFGILTHRYLLAILSAANNREITARQLTDMKYTLSSIYRNAATLKEKGLLLETGKSYNDGKESAKYLSTLKGVEIIFSGGRCIVNIRLKEFDEIRQQANGNLDRINREQLKSYIALKNDIVDRPLEVNPKDLVYFPGGCKIGTIELNDYTIKLLVLLQKGAMGAQELAENASIDVSTAYREVARLVEKGLIIEAGSFLNRNGKRAIIYKTLLAWLKLTFDGKRIKVEKKILKVPKKERKRSPVKLGIIGKAELARVYNSENGGRILEFLRMVNDFPVSRVIFRFRNALGESETCSALHILFKYGVIGVIQRGRYRIDNERDRMLRNLFGNISKSKGVKESSIAVDIRTGKPVEETKLPNKELYLLLNCMTSPWWRRVLERMQNYASAGRLEKTFSTYELRNAFQLLVNCGIIEKTYTKPKDVKSALYKSNIANPIEDIEIVANLVKKRITVRTKDGKVLVFSKG